MQKDTLLLVEDHQDIADMVYEFMQRRGFLVDYAADGISGLRLAVNNSYDAIVLDLMLPGMDGLELLSKLRDKEHKATPVLILTARDTLHEKIAGLESGADDYLVKPFEIQELEARVRALIRRNRGLNVSEKLVVGDLLFDTGSMYVERSGTELKLTPIGLRILAILMRASPKVVSRREIERQIWGDILPNSDTLRSHMYNLRKVIDKPFNTQLLHTVQNTGFKLVAYETESR